MSISFYISYDDLSLRVYLIVGVLHDRSTVSDSSFRFRFEYETGSIVAYKMSNCSVSFHGINVIVKDIHFQTIAHLTKLYFNF